MLPNGKLTCPTTSWLAQQQADLPNDNKIRDLLSKWHHDMTIVLDNIKVLIPALFKL